MPASRVQALSSRVTFRRGGLQFAGGRPVEIPEDHPLDHVLAILREPVLTIQVDNEGDGVFRTMGPVAREAAIAHVAAKLGVIAQIMAHPDTPEEPKQDVPAGDPAGGDQASGTANVFDGRTPLEALPGPLKAAIDAVTPAPVTPASPAVEPATAKPARTPRTPKAPKATTPASSSAGS